MAHVMHGYDDDLGERPPEDPVVQSLRAADLGEVEVVQGPDGQWGPRLVVRGAPQVAGVVSLARRLGVRVAVTQRTRPGIVALNLSRLADIDPPDERSCVIRVGAGAAVRDVEARAIQKGLTLGPMLPSSPNKSVGAWLAGPTRAQRAVPPGRLETVALALEAVLADGSLYRSREAPRSATGPDLDHLLLGGEGRFGLVTRATLRLFPRALVEAASARSVANVIEAIEALQRAVADGLLPAEARWERGRGRVEARFVGGGAAARARRFGSEPIAGRLLRAHLELAGSWRAWGTLSPLRPESLQLVALHTDGAFGALQFEDPDDADRAARHARAMGFAVVSPRRLRGLPVAEGAAGQLMEALARRVDAAGVFAR